MLNVFPNGYAARRQCTGNKTSDSHITQLVCKTTLFFLHLGYLTSDICEISDSLGRGSRRLKEKRRSPTRPIKAIVGEGDVIRVLFAMKAPD